TQRRGRLAAMKRASLLTSLLALLLLAPPAPLRATGATGETGEPVAAIDRFMASEMQRQRIPGAAVVVLRGGQVVLAKGYGLANVEHDVAVTPDTVFESGSMAKQFIAALVTMLADDGRLALDDPLTKFFPDAPATWQAITVRHLLGQTSGLGD